MSLFSIAVLVLLLFAPSREHRPNLGRHRKPCLASAARGPKNRQSCGKVSVLLVAASRRGCALVALSASCSTARPAKPLETSAGPWMLRETDRTATGQQRVDRVVFAAGGSRLAAICPRYDRLVIYDVKSAAKLALSGSRARRPPGRPGHLSRSFHRPRAPARRQRHVEPGWWETFDLDGNPQGKSRTSAGFYPDDVAVSLDGKHLYVISSGQAEGDPKKPMPAIETFELDLAHRSRAACVSRVEFDPRDDPARLALSASGRCAAVLLAKTNQTVAFDLSTPENPRLGRKDEALGRRGSLRLAIGRFRLDHDARGFALRGDRHRIAAARESRVNRRANPDRSPAPITSSAPGIAIPWSR